MFKTGEGGGLWKKEGGGKEQNLKREKKGLKTSDMREDVRVCLTLTEKKDVKKKKKKKKRNLKAELCGKGTKLSPSRAG